MLLVKGILALVMLRLYTYLGSQGQYTCVQSRFKQAFKLYFYCKHTVRTRSIITRACETGDDAVPFT